MRPTILPGPRRRAALAAAMLAAATLVAACGRLEDALSPGRRADEAPARVALAARLPALSKARAATVQLRLQAFYARADGTRVPMTAQVVPLDDAPTQQVPIAIDLSACLADAQRADDPAGACVVTIDVTLLEGDRVVDRQTVGPLKLQAGGVATVAEPVQLVEVAGVRVGPALGGAATGDGVLRLELGASVALGAAVTSTSGQAVSGRAMEWSSDAPGVARVDAATGVVAGVGVGRARVTATTLGGSGSVEIAVVPPPSPVSVEGTGAGGSGSVRSSPAGIDCRVAAGQAQGTCTFTFPGDARVTLTATPDFGTTFGVWGGACALAGRSTTCEVDAAQARGATVSFTAQRRLAVGGSGAGAVVGAPGEIACRIGADGASGRCDASYAEGTVVTLSAAPESPHAFAGWTGACIGESPTCTVVMTADAAVGARFAAPLPLSVTGGGEGSGTVAVAGAGSGGLVCAFGRGAASSCATTLPFGAVATLTAASDAGSTFAGWTGACTGTGACQVTMDEARLVGATFSRRAAMLSLSLGGPGGGSLLVGGRGACALAAPAASAACVTSVPIGEPVTIVAAPATGAGFAGWTGACAGRAVDSCTLTPTGDATVGARFTTEMVPLSVHAAGTTGGGRVTGGAVIACTIAGAAADGACAGSVPYGASVTLTATPDATSTFGGWGGACRAATGTSCVVPVTTAASVTARFDAARFPLAVTRAGAGGGAVTSAPAGIDCPGGCAATFAAGTSVTLSATPDAASTFAGWSGACAGAGTTCVVPMDAARGATATFVPVQPLTVAVLADPGASGRVTSTPAGIDCAASCARSFAAGTMVTLTAVPNSGTTFAGWSGACAGAGTTCSVTMSGARSVTATFAASLDPPGAAPVYALAVTIAGTGAGTVSSAPWGISCPGTCGTSYPAGTVVTLAAKPTVGGFLGWSGGPCSGTGTCVVTMDQARSVTATFRR